MLKHLGFLVLSLVIAMVLTVRAAASDLALTKTLSAAPLSVNEKGLTEFDKKAWSVSKDHDGAEVFTSLTKPESKGVVIRSLDGGLESMTTYALKGSIENASMLFFDKGSVKAFTQCEDRGEKDLGRVCVTATSDLCHAMKAGNVQADAMKDMDTFEMRALALLLTLRGSDHQLDNMARTGNRLGLKTALQTTKGQLLALSRVVAREVTSTKGPPIVGPLIDEKQAQVVLERSLPRLKQACLDTHFN